MDSLFQPYKLATYIKVAGSWWTKPTFAQPTVAINPDGTARIPIATGGIDQNATEIAVFVVPSGDSPPAVGPGSLPSLPNAVASLLVTRTQSSISGTITDGANHPISGAVISGAVLGQTVSAPDGKYSFFNIAATGTANLTVTFPDPSFATLHTTVTIPVGNLIVNFTAVSAGMRFVPVTPCRVLDTRNPAGPFGGPAITGNSSRDFNIPASACGVPVTAQAYSVNVAVVPAGSLGFITMWPTGQAQPFVSTLNSLDGRIKSNAAIVLAGTGGSITIYASDTTHAILDINGYFVPATDPTALAFYPVAPCRIADTRNPAGSWGGPSMAAGRAGLSPSFPAPAIFRRLRGLIR